MKNLKKEIEIQNASLMKRLVKQMIDLSLKEFTYLRVVQISISSQKYNNKPSIDIEVLVFNTKTNARTAIYNLWDVEKINRVSQHIMKLLKDKDTPFEAFEAVYEIIYL
jgi:predicted RNase H-related nuclease YkuK (DUF458 family)